MTVGGRTSAIIASLQILPDQIAATLAEKASKVKPKKAAVKEKAKGKRSITNVEEDEEEDGNAAEEEKMEEEAVDEPIVSIPFVSPFRLSRSLRHVDHATDFTLFQENTIDPVDLVDHITPFRFPTRCVKITFEAIIQTV